VRGCRPVQQPRLDESRRLSASPDPGRWGLGRQRRKQKSARTCRAYRLNVQHFMRTLSIVTPEELRQADHKAVIVWERYMRGVERAASSTIRRRLAALSSLYKHLVVHDHAPRATRSVRSNGRRSIATKGRPPPFRKRRCANCSTGSGAHRQLRADSRPSLEPIECAVTGHLPGAMEPPGSTRISYSLRSPPLSHINEGAGGPSIIIT
jgi:hypothetical protein